MTITQGFLVDKPAIQSKLFMIMTFHGKEVIYSEIKEADLIRLLAADTGPEDAKKAVELMISEGIITRTGEMIRMSYQK